MRLVPHAGAGHAGIAEAQPVLRSRGMLWDAIVQHGVAIGCALLVAVPILPMLLQALIDRPLYESGRRLTFGNFARLLSAPELPMMAASTVVFCCLAIAFSLVFGAALALLVGRTDLPGRHGLATLLLWPIFISPLILAFGAVIAYGPNGLVTRFVGGLIGREEPWNLYSLPGIAIVSGIAMVPMTVLYCLSSAQQQDPAMEAAARVAGAGPLRILRRVTLPLMRPALVYAFTMNLLSALEMLAIPVILGGPVGITLFTTFIFDKGFEAAMPDYGIVAAAGVVLMLMIALLAAVQNVLLRRTYRFVSIGARAGRAEPLHLGGFRFPALVLVAGYVVLTVGAIIGAVLLRSFTEFLSPYISPFEVLTLDNYTQLLSEGIYARSIRNTVVIALVGASIGTVVIAAVALVAKRSDYRFRTILDAVAQIPRAVPGILVGLGVFYLAIFVPGLGELRNTIWLLVIAYLLRHLPAGYGIVAPAVMQITSEFDRAARVAGASWLTTVRRIVLPLAGAALLSCWVLLAVLFLKEYAAAIFLYAPGSEIIGVTMLSAWVQTNNAGPVAALAIVQVALTTAVIVAANRLLKVKIHEPT